MKQKNKDRTTFRDLFWSQEEAAAQSRARRTLSQDIRSIFQFYLTNAEERELARMGFLKRSFFRTLWLTKNILSKLTVGRRVLMLISLYLLFSAADTTRFYLAYAVLVIILLFELKDKLLAHDELKAGRAIQEAMRPHSYPPLEGWDNYFLSQSANQVGGDLINCVSNTDGSVSFMVGDVSGKGLGAALLMAQLQASAETLLPHISSAEHLVSHLNRQYCRNDLEKIFISFIYLKAAPGSRTVEFVNAGHMPPLLATTHGVTELGKGGLALGLSDNAVYRKETVKVGDGDVLVIYTDGVTEARNAAGHFYGDKRLMTIIKQNRSDSAQAIAQAILNDIEKFSRHALQNDDLTLLVLKKIGERK